MPQTCPHCGFESPEFLHAYCTACREDLSATPEEVQKTAADTFKMVTGALTGTGTETPEAARAKLAGYSLWFTGIAAVGFVASVLAREWDKVILASVLLVLGAIWVRGEYRSAVVKTSVTKSGNPFTEKKSEEAK